MYCRCVKIIPSSSYNITYYNSKTIVQIVGEAASVCARLGGNSRWIEALVLNGRVPFEFLSSRTVPVNREPRRFSRRVLVAVNLSRKIARR